jgi:hypothetical protein
MNFLVLELPTSKPVTTCSMTENDAHLPVNDTLVRYSFIGMHLSGEKLIVPNAFFGPKSNAMSALLFDPVAALLENDLGPKDASFRAMEIMYAVWDVFRAVQW